MLHVAQNKNLAIFLCERCQGFHQEFAHFFTLERFRRDFLPIREIFRNVIAFVILRLEFVEMLHDVAMFFPPPHPGFIDRDASEPRAEPRVPAKLPEMREGLEYRLLRHFLSVGLVLQNRHRRDINLALIWPNQIRE